MNDDDDKFCSKKLEIRSSQVAGMNLIGPSMGEKTAAPFKPALLCFSPLHLTQTSLHLILLYSFNLLVILIFYLRLTHF